MTEQALAAGVQLKTGTVIKEVSFLGEGVTCEGKTIKRRMLINVAGPMGAKSDARSRHIATAPAGFGERQPHYAARQLQAGLVAGSAW